MDTKGVGACRTGPAACGGAGFAAGVPAVDCAAAPSVACSLITAWANASASSLLTAGDAAWSLDAVVLAASLPEGALATGG
jgi:hypothetical protein